MVPDITTSRMPVVLEHIIHHHDALVNPYITILDHILGDVLVEGIWTGW